MRIHTEGDLSKIRDHILLFNSIAGWPLWKKRFEEFDSWLSQNPLMEELVKDRYKLELAYRDIRKHVFRFGSYPWPIRNDNEYRFLSFMLVVNAVYKNLSPKGRERMAGIIRGCLKDDFGVSPFAFEMKIAAHLMQMGFEVDFHDLEDGKFDFLIRREGREIEVECKHISADVGRKIHRKALHSLGGALYPVLREVVDNNAGGTHIKITIPDRLSSESNQQKRIRDAVEDVLSGKQRSDSAGYSVEVSRFSIDGSIFERASRVTKENIAEFSRKQFGTDQKHSLLMYRNDRAAFISVKSQASDKVVTGIFQRLREESNRQFTKQRPAMMFVQLSDLTSDQLIEIANAQKNGTDIQRAISTLLSKRHFLHTVSLMTDGNVHLKTASLDKGERSSIQETGPTYTFHNEFNDHFNDPILRSVFQAQST